MEIKTAKGEVCLVSPEDYPYFQNGKIGLDKSGYFYFKSKTIHSIIISNKNLKVSNKECIDHMDRNKSNNQRHNLRITTYSKNNRNVSKPNGKYTSDFKGVSKTINRDFKVAINTNGKTYKYAYYACEYHAAHQYNLWCLELNVPPENSIPQEYIDSFIPWDSSKNFHEHNCIKNTKSGKFQVEITSVFKRINATFETLSEAIYFRDKCQSEIEELRIKKKAEKFNNNINKLNILLDVEIIEK